VVTQTRDAAGRLVSVSEQGNAGGGSQTRTQLNYYDASGQLRASEDAAGGRSYFFYDAKGRLEATVDATGALTRTYYDGSDRVVGTRQYANRLTTGSWLVAGKVLPTQVDSLGIVTNASLDRVSGRTYDAAGRLATQTDGLEGSAERSISTYTYDGAGRLLQVRTTDAAGTAGTARVVRYLHDEAGRQVGVLDAEGYLTETQYDRGGRVLSLTRYASASPTAYRATGTLAQLRPVPRPHCPRVISTQPMLCFLPFDGLSRVLCSSISRFHRFFFSGYRRVSFEMSDARLVAQSARGQWLQSVCQHWTCSGFSSEGEMPAGDLTFPCAHEPRRARRF